MEVTKTTLKHNNNNSASNTREMLSSRDETDFVVVSNNNNNNNNNNIVNSKVASNGGNNNNHKPIENIIPKALNSTDSTSKMFANSKKSASEHLQYQQQQQDKETAKSKKKPANNSTNTTDEHKKKISTKERLSLFAFGRRISQKAWGYKDCNANNSTTATSNRAASPIVERFEKSANPPTTTKPPASTAPPRQHKFVKSSSIARLLGNTYQHHAKRFEKHQQSTEPSKSPMDMKFHTYGGRRRSNGPYLERFKRYSKDDGDVTGDCDLVPTIDFTEVLEIATGAANETQRTSSGLERYCDHITVAPGADEVADLGSKTMRTLSRSLGRLWGKRLHSVDISAPDPEYKVSYLGNVLTGWAKGEGCVEKQLNTLWRNYTQNTKPDMIMRIKVSASGLKATTRQHGLTEYWANRITHCCAPKNYPRIFCWVYRHEGRKLKHELRCHAVLCSKEKVVQDICNTLKENLESALREFKREKILKQNARLSLANAAYENPSLPRRKILLSVGGNNYRPPLERSKSAPKLMAIEEAIGEEEGEEIEETNEPEMKSCCQKDSLYPAMTLGRRRCRRGHSIRRTGKARPLCSLSLDETQQRRQGLGIVDTCCHVNQTSKDCISTAALETPSCVTAELQRNSYGSDDSDDFEKLLKYNNYDSNASLTTELLPYFDMQLHKNTSTSLIDLCALKSEEEPASILPTINTDPMALTVSDLLPNDHDDDDEEGGHVGLRRNGVCSDGEEDYLDADDMYFRQASILNILHRNSMRKLAQLSLSSDESSSMETNASAPLQYRHQIQSSISSNASSTTTTNSSVQEGQGCTVAGKQNNAADSDEGSISSGCETASTVTANQDDLSLQYRHGNQLMQHKKLSALIGVDRFGIPSEDDAPITAEEIYQRLESRLQQRQNSDATTFSSSSTITLKMGTGSEDSLPESPNTTTQKTVAGVPEEEVTELANDSHLHRQRQRQLATLQKDGAIDDTDSECSDESGYVEFQEREKTVRQKVCEVEMRQRQQQQQPIAQQRTHKPQLPPKPMPRHTLSGEGSGHVRAASGTTLILTKCQSTSTAV